LLRQQNWGHHIKVLLLHPKFFAAATKRFVDRTKYFVVTKYFYPYFNK